MHLCIICFTSRHYINNWFYPSFVYILCDECTETGEYSSAKYQWRNRGGTFFFIYQGGGTFFYLSGFSVTKTYKPQHCRGREGNIFYSALPLPPGHKHSDIYLQLCTWDDYHIFLIATLVFTRLLVDGIDHLIELLLDWLMMWNWFSFVCLLIWF